MRYSLELPEGVKIAKAVGESEKVTATSDADPREFMLDVANWSNPKSIKLAVTYAACVGAESCYTVRQSYTLQLRRDKDGGSARGEGAGFWDAKAFTEQLLAGDKNGDGKLSRDETAGLVLPHFDHFDKNKDGFLDREELKAVADWLNHHHRPGPAPTMSKRLEQQR